MIDTNKVNEAYSSEPWWYDIRGMLILFFAYRSSLSYQIKFFGNNIGQKHLEAAIGSGSLFRLILIYRKLKRLPQPSIDGFDYADKMIWGARNRFKKYPNINLFKADAAQTNLPDNTYDTINIANAIHCLPEVERSFSEFHRILKPNCKLTGNCLLYPKGNSVLDKISDRINRWGAKKGILNRPYYQEEIVNLLNSTGFKLIFENTHGNCFNFIAQKL